ncbi:NBAS subunit of NRZ tethering complex isoform X2 [Nematostella vectensis]|uniref:NBAS subunit of NRZ tethering complex isoform X2 n=1 Tax=Nematostella vectensis TaxID=45351 RepID=UPI00207778AF|nr:NBAS subunit of NRZ tethering complex isoform X2 [Nematostella vectensis]
MATEQGNEDSILYDLLVDAEWPLEGEILSKPGIDLGDLRGSLPKKCWTVTQNSLKWVIHGIQHIFSGSSLVEGIPAKLHQFVSGGLKWRIVLSSDGRLVAILQENCIEIRSLKDDFATVVSKCPVEEDPYPQWRRVAWSQDCSMLACSHSSGEVAVYDLAGELLFTIQQTSPGSVGLPLTLSSAVSGLIFIEHKSSAQWAAELLVIHYDGSLTNYSVSPTNGYQENHRFSFSHVLHHGVYCMLYHPQYNMLLLGATAERHANSIADDVPTPLDCGLSAWRILSGFPHYKLIEDDHIEIKAGSDMLKRITKLSPFRSVAGKDGIISLCLSPDGSKLAAVHLSGTLTMWEVPSLRHSYAWSAMDQPAVEDPEADIAFQGLKRKRETKDEMFFGLTAVSWWSPEALILSHSKGAVTVTKIRESLHNLLGTSPEWCEPWSQTTQAHNGGFLILECENTIRSSRGGKVSISEDERGELPHSDDEDSEDEEATFGTKSRHFASQVMFFLTESERFQPPVKRPKILHRTYRLVCIRSTTPEELYARKIELEEYGDALVLAQTYNLDSDLVYQKQWRKARVSVASIHDYLSKVKNRLWVLNECVERVPETFDAAKQLLEYGLRGTDARVVRAVGNGETDLGFIMRLERDEHAHEEEGKHAEELKEIEGSLDFASFNLEQRDICRYRLRLLQYLDRLDTYEVILGGSHVAHEEYDWELFQRFRDINIVQAAVEYAREGNHEAVESIFTYHGEATLPHWLAILCNFPETLPPSEYSGILPEAGFQQGDPDVLPWEQKFWRNRDWCEQTECKKMLDWGEEGDAAEFLYEECPDLAQYRAEMTSELLTFWYQNRAADIERYSKQVDNALELVKLGLERGVKDLKHLHDDLVTLEDLIYECKADVTLGLDQFQQMTDLDKLRMLLSKSSEVCFVGDFKRWATPFLQRVNKCKPGSQTSLLRQYLTDIAKTDLTYVLKVFQNSTPELKEPLIADMALLMKLALECIYICKREDQVDLAFSILECLPAPDDAILSEQVGELNKKIDQLEVNLCACEILARHGIPKPVSFIIDTQGNKKEAQELMKTLTSLTAKRTPVVKEKGWQALLKDMLRLQEKTYNCIDTSVCYEIYAETLLYSGHTDNVILAGHMLCKSPLEDDHPAPQDPLKGPRVPYAKAVELVLGASKEYFNSSNDLSDSAMDLARACLNLIDDRPPLIQEEFNLIAALGLLDDFNVQILPLEVRLCDDKLGLVKRALDGSPSAYTKTNKVLRLAGLLQVSGQDEVLRRGRVRMLVAQAAFQEKDYDFACSMCRELIKEGYEDAWTICRVIGETEEYKDLKARQSLLAFALTHCSPDAIEELIHSRSLVETQILYTELSRQMDTIDEKQTDEPEGSTVSRSLMTGRDWLKTTVTWLRPLQKGTQNGSVEHHSDKKIEDKMTQMFHPFYSSLIRDEDSKQFDGLPYEKLLRQRRANGSFNVSHCLLRTQKLCECRAEGSVEEPATEVLLQLSESLLEYDTTQALAYLLALPKLSEASELFQKYSSSYLCLHVAAYCYALDLYSRLNPDLRKHQPAVFTHKPTDVIEHVVRFVIDGVPSEWSEELHALSTCLLQWYNQMADFSQAQLLQSLGRGVDIGRFARDSEYKRETILGLTMTLEEEVFNTAVSLAERYDVPGWLVLMTHLEWLFTDSGLATKEIQERVNKTDIMTTLLQDAPKMYERMRDCVYPTIDGGMHARLIYYYMLLQQCQEKDTGLVDGIDASTHLKLLKKIKSAAPGLDYKKLMSGDDPLAILGPVLTSANVHLLAKLATKIPSQDGGYFQPSGIFRVFLERLFWEGDQKARESESDDMVDWAHRYVPCHVSYLSLRLTGRTVTRLATSSSPASRLQISRT